MARTGRTGMLIKIADDNVETIICNGIETYSVKCQFTVFDFDTVYLLIYRWSIEQLLLLKSQIDNDDNYVLQLHWHRPT